MLLTVTMTHQPATDLDYLLHKNPVRCQSFPLSFGSAHVFYPEATEDRCTAALLLEVDPVAMVRGKGGLAQTVLAQYVNDRPYVASSFMSAAIAQVAEGAHARIVYNVTRPLWSKSARLQRVCKLYQPDFGSRSSEIERRVCAVIRAVLH